MTTVPCEADHEWSEALRGTVFNYTIPHCSERFPNGGQIWECMRSRCVLDRNGKVMSRFSVVDQLDVQGKVTPRLAAVGLERVRLKFLVRRPLGGR